jgi:hypothetical protein
VPFGASLPHATDPAENQRSSRARHLKQDTEPAWHALCFTARRRIVQMYSILYIIGAIVVIIVVLRVLGLV